MSRKTFGCWGFTPVREKEKGKGGEGGKREGLSPALAV